MAYDSELGNWSDVNEIKIPELYVKYGDLDGCADVNELRALFDQVLAFFLKEVCVNKKVFRPFPPKLGDGQEADLFKLFLTIRRIGSYELVSENNLWEFVARECGLKAGLVASLKLIYIKYLKELDQWLLNGGFKDGKMENLEVSVVEKLDRLSRKLGRALIDVEIIGFDERKEGASGFNQVQGDDDEKSSVGDHKRCELSPKFVKKVGVSMVNDEVKRNEVVPDNVVMKVRLSVNHDDDNVVKHGDHPMIDYDDDDDDDVNNVVSHNVNTQKRKRDEDSLELSEMLDWLANVARDPHDNAYDTSSQRSKKGKNNMTDHLRKRVLSSRRALFAELKVDSGNDASGSQKKTQKMQPSMYEDDKVKLRCSRRTTAAVPCPLKRQQTESSNIRTDRFREILESHDQDYNLGPLFQAEVPPWTGVLSDSDPKWLGTHMWPPPDRKGEEGSFVIGLGRQESCECVFPGSAECVRFHIAENRLKIKIELGTLFYKWKFNQMGEEISLAWEPEEEKRFKSLVIRARHELAHSMKSRREIMNAFWRKASVIIPDKLKQNVVSYYFNVFVIRRRSYQNRVTPRDIDSDNDEVEVGSVGDRFGYEKIHGLSLKCSENLQCTNLES
ncbi:putative transcription factor & chromatin remodeling ARID family [Helianthus annuus]|nr:putative transcription factor & chromatin remodeling ARID family [Helianthus annuus]